MLENKPALAPVALIGREKLIACALGLIDRGTSVDIVGIPGSGRTAVLAAIGARIEDRGRAAVRLRGIAGLRAHPLAALHAAGIGSAAVARDQRPASAVQHAVDALDAATSAPASVLVVDDAAQLDEASLGVVQAVRMHNGIPVVSSYAADAPVPESMEAGYRLELEPLRFDDLEALAVQRLGAPIEGTTMSRLYAQSGGTPGVALALLDAGRHDGSLSLMRGAWVSDGSLWSPLLQNQIEKQLGAMDDRERESLELISLLGGADVETVLELCPAELVERLESAGAVRLVASEGTPIVTVATPHLTEYFRRSTPGLRSLRLAERVRTVLGRADLTERIDAEGTTGGHRSTEYPILVRLIRDRADTRLAAAAVEWEEHPGAATALPLLQAVAAGEVTDAQRADILADTGDCDGDPEELMELAEMRSLFQVTQGRPLTDATAELLARADALGLPATLTEAAAIRLSCAAGQVPLDAQTRLADTVGAAPTARIRILETTMRTALSLGRVSEAFSLGEEIDREDAWGDAPTASALFGVVLLARGDHSGAIEWAQDGIGAAKNRLDAAGIRSHGFVAALALALAGRYAEAERVIADVLALGTPSPVQAGAHFRLLAVAEVIAARRDNPDLREKLASEIATMSRWGHPGAPVLAAWRAAQSLAFEGHPREASVALQRLGEQLWEQNERLLGAFALLASIELHADAGRLAEVTEWMTHIDSELLRVRLEFLTARQNEDAPAMLALPSRLHRSGQPGIAVTAFRLAAEWAKRTGDHETAARAEAEREELVAGLGRHPYDTVRFSTVAVNLTEREREIGRLVANGLTNPQIAAHLVLSVRTVESHLHRIMRKTAVANRAELATLISGMNR